MNGNSFCKKLETHALTALFNAGFKDGMPLCIGVSGGADSVCLLTSIVKGFQDKYDGTESVQRIKVVTVNHRIRSEAESGGDCEFVSEYCKGLASRNVVIECQIVELKKGQVMDLAAKRKRGTEEAARILRYEAFDRIAEELSYGKSGETVYFLLAHNQNDQLETLLMRFLSGAGNESRNGIMEQRTVQLENNNVIKYVRPLLNISREEIEKYLTSYEKKWRTDATNSDNSYLRNKIRNTLIPVLDETFSGWKTAVLSGRKKAVCDNEFIAQEMKNLHWEEKAGKLQFSINEFEKLNPVLRQRLLYKAFNYFGEDDRIPYSFVTEVAGGNYSLSGYGFEIISDGNFLSVKKLENKATIYGFFDIIEEDGLFEFDFGTLHVCAMAAGDKRQFARLEFVTNDGQRHFLSNIPLPFIFRSRQSGDAVLTKNRSLKSVSDVLSDFKVDVEHKNFVPVIQDTENGNQIVALWGEIFGYQNWIVQ